MKKGKKEEGTGNNKDGRKKKHKKTFLKTSWSRNASKQGWNCEREEEMKEKPKKDLEGRVLGTTKLRKLQEDGPLVKKKKQRKEGLGDCQRAHVPLSKTQTKTKKQKMVLV